MNCGIVLKSNPRDAALHLVLIQCGSKVEAEGVSTLLHPHVINILIHGQHGVPPTLQVVVCVDHSRGNEECLALRYPESCQHYCSLVLIKELPKDEESRSLDVLFRLISVEELMSLQGGSSSSTPLLLLVDILRKIVVAVGEGCLLVGKLDINWLNVMVGESSSVEC